MTVGEPKTKEEYEKIIKECTQALKSSSINPQTFIKRANAYEQLENYEEAFKDVRNALSLDHSNKQYIEKAHQILKKSTDKVNSRTPTNIVRTLIADCCNESEDIKKRVESAERLAALTKDIAFAKITGQEGGVEFIVNALMNEVNKKDNQEFRIRLRMALIGILSKVSGVKEYTTLILERINKTSISLLIDTADEKRAFLGMDLLKTLFNTAIDLPLNKIRILAQAREISLDHLCNILTQNVNTNIKVNSVHTIINIIVDKSSAIAFTGTSGFAILLGCAAEKDDRIKPMVALAVSRIISHMNGEDKSIRESCESNISNWLNADKESEKIKGLSALASVFQANVDVGKSILLSKGFLADIMDTIDFESEQFQTLFIDVLSQACADKVCRQNIAERCTGFLLKNLKLESKNEIRIDSALVLTKLMFIRREITDMLLKEENLSDSFINRIIDDKRDLNSRTNAIEGLSYMTIFAPIKEKIAKNDTFLKSLTDLAKCENQPLQYGITTIIDNITQYPRELTEEEKQLKKIKEFSKEQSVIKDDERDKAEYVVKRIENVLKNNGILTLIALSKTESVNAHESLSQIFLNIVTEKKFRGQVVQQGGVKVLFKMVGKGNTEKGIMLATQALAKIAITMDPRLAFKSAKATDLVRPLIIMCKKGSLLQQFEALMALTNLGSVDDDLRMKILKEDGIKAMESLQFTENVMVRRAATEALCNMMYEPEVYTSYIQSPSKIKLLVALSDVEDFETRRAASGALAVLSQAEEITQHIKKVNYGYEVIKSLLEDKSEELQHRGAEITKNIIINSKKGDENLNRLKNMGCIKQLEVLTHSRLPAISRCAVEALLWIRKNNLL
ncbi:ARM repeat-containing protein [Piromyces finnis]|uniref:ARM repeat-containing protein n=1 Tax=Piromyces finnis TaxID=1754191 RepID=A0A1Y1VJF4_9FUNG|nr:ARM repeat-containing protein [Piromyces finnis]|eukprot:ORX57842.1 ARM repeat-containing protein [Piromyces finnis]